MAGLLDSDGSYSGTESYRYVERLIREGGDLDIVSPYISLTYAKMLARHARRHRVRLITSRSRPNKAALEYLNGALNPHRGWAKAALFTALLSAAAFALGYWEALALLGALTAALAAAAALMRGRRHGNLMVKLSGGTFVHEKIYLSEGRAITGSANLTYSGLHRNLEHVELTTGKDRLGKLAGHFGALWGSLP